MRPAKAVAGLICGPMILAGVVLPSAGAVTPGGVSVSLNPMSKAPYVEVAAEPGSDLTGADVLIGKVPSGVWVRIDPEASDAAFLSAGSGCALGVPPGEPVEAFATGMSVVCEGPEVTRAVIDLGDSTYSGGDLLIVIVGPGLSGRFYGSAFGDYFQGGPEHDYAFGADGDDFLFGGDSDDVLVGGDGADSLDGEAGSDDLRGGTGPDKVVADEDGRVADTVDCNEPGPARGTDNAASGSARNAVSFDRGVDRILDCGNRGAPLAKTAASLSGAPLVNRPFSVTPAKWQGSRIRETYEWFTCLVPVVGPASEDPSASGCTSNAEAGGSAKTYTPRSYDVGRYLLVRVTATNADGYATSTAVTTSPVAAGTISVRCQSVKGSKTPAVKCQGQVTGFPRGTPVEAFVGSRGSWTAQATAKLPSLDARGRFAWSTALSKDHGMKRGDTLNLYFTVRGVVSPVVSVRWQ